MYFFFALGKMEINPSISKYESINKQDVFIHEYYANVSVSVFLTIFRLIL